MHDTYVVIYNDNPKANFDSINVDDFDVSSLPTSEHDMVLLLKERNKCFAHLWSFNSKMVQSKFKFIDIPRHLKTVGPMNI